MQTDSSEQLATNNGEFANVEFPNPRKLKTMIRYRKHFNRTETVFIVNISKSAFFLIIQKKPIPRFLPTAKYSRMGYILQSNARKFIS